MAYIAVTPDMDSYDLANAIIAAEKAEKIDEALLDKALDWIKRATGPLGHGALRQIDFERHWRPLGHHAAGKTFNTLNLPEGPLRLNRLYYPTLMKQPLGIAADGTVQFKSQLDDYPDHFEL